MTLLLRSDEALAAGLEVLTRRDVTIAELVTAGARPTLRFRAPGYEGLAAIVVGQQVSTASAAAIFGRLKQRLPNLSAEAVAAASDEELRACGLSRPKIRTLRAAAEAVRQGSLPLDGLGNLPADEAHRHLVAVPGIGPWTADVYLLFCLGHPDAFPAGDLALQEAARDALGLPTRPGAKELTGLADRWRPWRGVAAKVLWAHYRRLKAREGAPA